jgi:aminopeptidase N
VALDTAHEHLNLESATELPKGEARLHITFTAQLNDKMRGFYRSTYKDADGTDRIMAASQMEVRCAVKIIWACACLQSTYARLAFPCWDEPEFKARFDVTLIVDANLVALSNMVCH